MKQFTMKHLLTFFACCIMYTTFAQDLNKDWGNLQRYAFANKRLGKPASNEKRVVFMGNSITELWNLFHSDFFTCNNYINRGISGQTTPQMLIRFRQDVVKVGASVVVILAGINDIAENTGPITVDDIMGNIVSMVQIARDAGVKPILCSVLPAYRIPWRPIIQPVEKVLALNKLIQEYAHKNNLSYVDYYTAMVDERKGIRKELSDDEVHPNAKGYAVMEPLVLKAIQKELK